MDIYSTLVVTHIFGTVLGVGGATFAEIFLLKSLSNDGTIDPTESRFLKTTYAVMRTGLALAILSGFGFLLLYRLQGTPELIYQAPLLAKITIIVLLVFNAIGLHVRIIPMWLGASISLVSWYAAFIIGAYRDIPLSYISIMVVYVLAVVVSIPILKGLLRFFTKKAP